MSTQYVQCYCSFCAQNNGNGFDQVTSRTRNEHKKRYPQAESSRKRARADSSVVITYYRRVDATNNENLQSAETPNTPLVEYEDYTIFDAEDDSEVEDFEGMRQTLEIDLDAEEEVLEGEDVEQSEANQERLDDINRLPKDPLSFVFVILMNMFIGRFLTDQAAEILMAFLNVGLSIAGSSYQFPKKVTTFKSRTRLEDRACSGLTTYVSCTSCHSIYKIPESNDERHQLMKCASARRVSEYGGNVHSNCENSLYDISSKGSCTPKAYFLYNSVIETLKKFYMRDGFAKSIAAWKKRKLVHLDYMFDCYDAHVFKSFKIDPRDNEPFVDLSDHNLMFSFNVDWFQQFNNSPYSCGAMYLTCLNLPRSIRNLRENMIFVGLMPGGNGEASLEQLNHYLEPLVNELLILKDGIQVGVPSSDEVVTVRGACTLFVCDLPAASKALGFSYFNSTYACRRCDVPFPRLPNSRMPDFSELNVDQLQQRNNTSNRAYANRFKTLTSHTARQRHVQEHRTRWSQFHRLPYLDVVKFTVFDPMHNVWIGTCKRVVHHVFLKRELISKEHLMQMAEMCKNITLPPGYDNSSIARKISLGTGFTFMKADEWRVFTIALSPLLFKGRLDTQYYQNWMIFVECMQVMCLPGISRASVEHCHSMIKDFARGFLTLYGKEEMMSNLHYHFHLKEDMINFGPWASHQCFNYERYNADMKGIRTNGRKGLERTLVKRMLSSIHRNDASNFFPPTGRPDLDKRIKQLYFGKDISGAREEYVERYLREEIEGVENDIETTEGNVNFDPLTFISYSGNLDGNGYEFAFGYEQLPVATIKSLYFDRKESKMKTVEYQQLKEYYSACFEERFVDEGAIPMNTATNTYTIVFNKIVKFKQISIMGQKYRSLEARSKRGSLIYAYYRDPQVFEQEHQLRPAEIQYFFRHDVELKDGEGVLRSWTFTFAYVRWFDVHPSETTLTTFDSINTTTFCSSFLPDSELSILPVHCIHSPAGIYRNILENYDIIIKFNRKIIDC